ncbi:hypothetical protein [Pleionea litopenaei]|uniref:Uncharacterized protein n=1 Tax=Pleionea litopenaei TaxID=3070815 RepID=A0AA51X934_9GAMM|nr:hypothetical protein [Pleionea sp. HL-JVS1]WMS88750.1 hypothetical protein Q9312_07485 [Pleionea sp. HL-JVS1]
MKDHFGNKVFVGDKVKVITVNEESLANLESELAQEIRDAVGQVFKVDFIDEHQRAWVDIVCTTGGDELCGQTLFLRSHQISKVV